MSSNLTPSAISIVFLLLGCLFQPAAMAETISWMVEDAPPFFIRSGVMADRGPGDVMLRRVMGWLPGFQHHIVGAETSRIFNEIRKHDGVCDLVAQRNEAREAFTLFNQRPLLAPSFRMMILKSRSKDFAPMLNRAGEIDLRALAPIGGLRGGYVLAQLNPPVIDQFIQDPSRRTQLEGIPSAQQSARMVAARRLDFFFTIGIEGQDEDDAARARDSFLRLPIAGVPSMAKFYIACSNQPIGREVIRQLDERLGDDGNWADYLEPLRNWMEPTDFATALTVPANSVSP